MPPASGASALLAGRQLRWSFCDADTGQLAADIQIQKLERGHQKKGLFRIGLLPMAQAEGVTIRVVNDALFRKNFAAIEKSFATSDRKLPVFLSQATVSSAAAPGEVLRIRSARLLRNGEWEITGGELASGADVQPIQAARLKLEGPALKLQITAPAAKTIELFSAVSPQKHSNNSP